MSYFDIIILAQIHYYIDENHNKSSHLKDKMKEEHEFETNYLPSYLLDLI